MGTGTQITTINITTAFVLRHVFVFLPEIMPHLCPLDLEQSILQRQTVVSAYVSSRESRILSLHCIFADNMMHCWCILL